MTQPIIAENPEIKVEYKSKKNQVDEDLKYFISL
jgi:hypothetical protein